MVRKWKRCKRTMTLLAIPAAVSLWLPEPGLAQFGSFSVGGAASGRSAAVAFDNPAGMVRLENQEYRLGFVTVDHEIDFVGSSARYIGPVVEGASRSQSTNTAANFFYVRPGKGKWSFGFGFFTLPTVRDIAYDRILAQVTKEKFNMFNFGPSFAYRVNDKFSIGATLNIEYADFWCNMMLPELDEEGNWREGMPGFLTTYGDDWEIGYRIGLLYQFTPETRAGLTYISVMDHLLTGYSTYSSQTIPDSRAGGYQLGFPIPPVAVLSLHHSFNDQWAVMGTVNYAWWERYWERVHLENLVAPPPFTELIGDLQMEDTVGVALGFEFDPEGSWAFVAEFKDEEGPTVDDRRSIKDYPNGFSSITLGARKFLTDNLWLDFGYVYTDGDDAPIPGGTGTGETGLLTWDSQSVGVFLGVKP